MKKYRLTKITVKTREIISVPKTAAKENETAVCPFCHAPLPALSAPHDKDAAELLNAFSGRNLTEEK